MHNPPKNDTPDKALVLAREVVADMKEADDAHHTAKLLRAGEYDEITEVRLVLAGIEAALSQPQHGGLVIAGPPEGAIERAFRAGHVSGFDAADSSSRSQASHVEDAWADYVQRTGDL